MANKEIQPQIDRDEWEQIPDEPTYWYDLFTQYRLLGPTRTLRKLYRMKRDEKGLKPMPREWGASRYWTEKSREWDWQNRAEAWDDYIRDQASDVAEGVLTEGLALPHIRVEKLKLVAQKLEEYILDPKVVKPSSESVEQYRGVLDDIAKETGGRKEIKLLGGVNGGQTQQIVTVWGRGGSASDAWEKQKQLPPPQEQPVDGEVTDITEQETCQQTTND